MHFTHPFGVTHPHLSFVQHHGDAVTNGEMNGRQSVNALNGGCANKSCHCQPLGDLFVPVRNRLSVTSVPTSLLIRFSYSVNAFSVSSDDRRATYTCHADGISPMRIALPRDITLPLLRNPRDCARNNSVKLHWALCHWPGRKIGKKRV